jgi:hypothetical protein
VFARSMHGCNTRPPACPRRAAALIIPAAVLPAIPAGFRIKKPSHSG